MASIKCNKVEDALRMLEIELGNGSKKQIVSDRLVNQKFWFEFTNSEAYMLF